MWLTYAPIPDFVMSFYSISRTDVDWFSVVFFIVSVVVGFVGIFILDTWGLKISVSSVGPMAYNLLYTVKRGIKCVWLCAYVYWPSLRVLELCMFVYHLPQLYWHIFDCCIMVYLWCTFRKQAASITIVSLRKIGIVHVTWLKAC